MSLSEIRVNTTKTRTGVGTITYTETGPVITGIATASNFKTGSTNVHSTGVELANINTGGSTATFGGPISGTTASFSGTVSIGGTLTYEDVTNIDSVGVITARSTVSIGDSINHIGDTDTAIRFPSANTITAETSGSERLRIDLRGNMGLGANSIDNAASGNDTVFAIRGKGSSYSGRIEFQDSSGNKDAGIHVDNGILDLHSDPDNATSNSLIRMHVDNSEKIRITSAGRVGVGTITPHSSYRFDIRHSADTILHLGQGGATLANMANNSWNALSFQGTNAELGLFKDSSGNFSYIMGTYQGGTAIPIVFRTGNRSERMRITQAGKVGIGHYSESQITNGKELSIRPANDGGIRLIRPGDTISSPNTHLDITTTTAGSVFPSGEAYTVKYKTYNSDQIFETYAGGGTGGNISFRTSTSNNSSESVRITKDGDLLVGTTSGAYRLNVQEDLNSGGNLAYFGNSDSTYSQGLSLSFDSNKDIEWSGGSGAGGMDWNMGTRGYKWRVGGNDRALLSQYAYFTLDSGSQSSNSKPGIELKSTGYTGNITKLYQDSPNAISVLETTERSLVLDIDSGSQVNGTNLSVHIDGTEEFRFDPGSITYKNASNTSRGTLLAPLNYYNNTNHYMDLTQWRLSDNWNVLEVFGTVNPNSSGSGAYADPVHMYIYRGTGWDQANTAIAHWVYCASVAPPSRHAFPSGTGYAGNTGVSAVWYTGSSVRGNKSSTSTDYVRILIPNANGSNAFVKTFRVMRRY